MLSHLFQRSTYAGQWFIARNPDCPAGDPFKRQLFVFRKPVHHLIGDRPDRPAGEPFYIASLSARTLLYQGMRLAPYLSAYYPDRRDARLESALALVHQRFSTATA